MAVSGLTLLAFSPSVRADDDQALTQTSISLDNNGLPAGDLVYPTTGPDGKPVSKILSPQEAWLLKTDPTHPVDLSKLDPDATADEYKGFSTITDRSVDDALPIADGQDVGFLGIIRSSSGLFRFNVQVTPAGNPPETLTLMMSEQLHTYLLRKEILRRLGYKVPAMKWIPTLKIHFPDAATRDQMVKEGITPATYGAPGRWCTIAQSVIDASPKNDKFPCRGSKTLTDPLEVDFQDMVAMEATPTYYNLTLGPPTPDQALVPRILRSLAVIYGLVDFNESLNQTPWTMGSIQDKSVQFDTQERANFACTLDDAEWILNKIQSLTRDDFLDIAKAARYPDDLTPLVVEKMISHRDSVLQVFGYKTPTIKFNPGISVGKTVKNGKVLQQEWPGYASRFAYADPTSPLAGIKYYFISEAMNNTLANLLSKANSEIPSLNTTTAIANHENDLATKWGSLLATGAIQSVPVGVWVAPTLSGTVIASRDVVLGAYLGTNNLVQLVDSFGFQVNAGLYVGVDGLAAGFGVNGSVQGSVNMTWTHLKPLTKGMKQAVSEPFGHIVTPLIFKKAAGIFGTVANLKNNSTLTSAELNKALNDDLDSLKGFIDVGESLILTESLSGTETAGVSYLSSAQGSLGASLNLSGNQMVLSRLHFYRKDQNTIQVFKDAGEISGAQLAFEVSVGAPAQFPLLSITAGATFGTAQSKIFNVNIDPNLNTNPNLYVSAAGLAAAIRQSSVGPLEGFQTPTKIKVKFTDLQSQFNFFTYERRTLRTNGAINISLPDGEAADFISLTDGAQSGARYQGLAGDAATYLIQRLTGNSTYNLNLETNPNPGQSLLGHSQTRDTSFQGLVNSTPAPNGKGTVQKLASPFVRVGYRWEGWDISKKDTLALAATLAKKYGFTFFRDGFLNDTTDIKLYELEATLNFYPEAINAVMGMSSKDEIALARRYGIQNNCDFTDDQLTGNIGDPMDNPGVLGQACNDILDFEDALDYNRAGKFKSPTDQAQAIFSAITKLENFATFPDLTTLMGGSQNFYVTSEITGFRTGSEQLSDPIYGNTFGHQKDPNSSGGVLDDAEQMLGVQDGEFGMKWIRTVL